MFNLKLKINKENFLYLKLGRLKHESMTKQISEKKVGKIWSGLSLFLRQNMFSNSNLDYLKLLPKRQSGNFFVAEASKCTHKSTTLVES